METHHARNLPPAFTLLVVKSLSLDLEYTIANRVPRVCLKALAKARIKVDICTSPQAPRHTLIIETQLKLSLSVVPLASLRVTSYLSLDQFQLLKTWCVKTVASFHVAWTMGIRGLTLPWQADASAICTEMARSMVRAGGRTKRW